MGSIVWCERRNESERGRGKQSWAKLHQPGGGVTFAGAKTKELFELLNVPSPVRSSDWTEAGQHKKGGSEDQDGPRPLCYEQSRRPVPDLSARER